MYTVAVTRDFIARHFLIGGDWGSENAEHAHHYVVEVSVQGKTLDQHGYLVDIMAIESALDAVVADYCNALLNDKKEFSGLNPSLEHFSRIIGERLTQQLSLPASTFLAVKLWENERCWASWRHEH